MYRTTREIIDDHLSLRKQKKVEEDIFKNYATDVIIIDKHQVLHGHEGVKKSASELQKSIPNATYNYERISTEEHIGYLVWKAKGDGVTVEHGVDTFVIKSEKIVVQTVYYDVKSVE